MEAALVLTVADLRGRVIVDWEQDVQLSFAYKRSPSMIVKLVPNLVLPKAVFKYQLHQADVEGTANGGVRWWCEKVAFSSAMERQTGFDTRACSAHSSTIFGPNVVSGH